MIISKTHWQTLNEYPLSFKLFISLLLWVAVLCYAALLVGIWFDTEMKIPYISEGYGMMDAVELVQHSITYLFWFLGIFTVTGFVFLLTPHSEKIKRVFAVLVPLLILLDIGSQWLISVHEFFAYSLVVSGFLLALSFGIMFLMIQWDIWLNKASEENVSSL